MMSSSFNEFVLDQLSGLADVSSRAMFGGQGVYSGKTFFAIIYRDRLYFKTGDVNRPAYERRGMKPFRPNERQTMRYHEVPADVIEDATELANWARESISISHAD